MILARRTRRAHQTFKHVGDTQDMKDPQKFFETKNVRQVKDLGYVGHEKMFYT